MNETPAWVLVTTSFPIGNDGSEAAGSFVSDLAEELAHHVPVRVVAPGPRSMREAWAEGVEVFRFAAPDKPLSTLKPWNPGDLLDIRRVLNAGMDATRLAAQAGPTAHILALWALPSGHWAQRVSSECAIPYSVWTLGSDIWTLGRMPIVRGYVRRVLQHAHTCYSDGYKLAADTHRLSGRDVQFLASTRRMEGARQRPLKSAPPYRLLFLGRWHPNKGVDLLLDALAQLSDADWQKIEVFDIHGGGPMESAVRDRVQALKRSGRPVAVGGYLDKPAAEKIIGAADYVVIPSRIESIPVVFSDAVKLGCPVITTPVGDLKELVEADPPCGLVADAVSAAAIAAAISSAVNRPADSFSTGLERAARMFDLASVANRVLATADSHDQHSAQG